MDKQLATYIRQHIVFVSTLLILGFLVLGAGEYYLYRQQMYLNQMISEGFMMVNTKQDEVMKNEKLLREDQSAKDQDQNMMDENSGKTIEDMGTMMGQ